MARDFQLNATTYDRQEVVYPNVGFTPAWSVTQWWLAGARVPPQAVCVSGANVIDRRSADVLTAHWSVFYSFLFNVVG